MKIKKDLHTKNVIILVTKLLLGGPQPQGIIAFLPAFCSDSEQVGPRKPWQKLSFCQTCGRHEWSRRCGLIISQLELETYWDSPPKKNHQKIGSKFALNTPSKFNSSPLKIYHPKKERIIFQPSFFRGKLLNFGRVIDASWLNYQNKLPGIQVTFVRFSGFSAGHFLTSTVAEPRKEVNAAHAGGDVMVDSVWRIIFRPGKFIFYSIYIISTIFFKVDFPPVLVSDKLSV